MTDSDLCNSYIDICNIHVLRLTSVLTEISPLFPISAEKITTLPLIQLGFLELLTSRFAKLQDCIGQQLFPLILKLLKEDLTNKSFIDYLNTLERIGALPSTAFWISLREIRNSVAHEYPDQPNMTAEKLNLCYTKTQELLSYWQHLLTFINTRIYT